MSRIQNILEKAEREGSVQRLHGDPLTPSKGPVPFADAPPPVARYETPVRNDRAASAVPAIAPGRTISGTRLDRLLITATAPDAVTSEQYRSLRTRILYNDTGAALKLLLVTSPGRGDGKSLTAANLALAMAQEPHRRVCLVDANLRNPRVQRLLGLPEGEGLSDVLVGHAVLDDVLVTMEEQQLTVLPAGHSPVSPAELLGTTAMRRTFDTLRSRFDEVVIDAPAATPLADVGILTPLVDAVLMVVRAGVTSKPSIHHAVQALDASKLLGVVLNEAA
jgi:receptor protein-tyrosine kinase